MSNENSKVNILAWLSIIIGSAFFIGFLIKVNIWYSYTNSLMDCFLVVATFLSSFYLIGGIGLLKGKGWSVTLIKLISLTWLVGVLEVIFFSLSIPPNLWSPDGRYFFTYPLGMTASLIRDFPVLAIVPIMVFLPFIILPSLFLYFCAHTSIKDRFGIKASKGKNFIILIFALCLPLLIYSISLSNFGLSPNTFKETVCSQMTWEEFEIYKRIEELTQGKEFTDYIEKKVAREFQLHRNYIYGIWVKGMRLLNKWEEGGKGKQEFLRLDREKFEKTVNKYGRPQFIGGVKCY
ncbi:hypothetical protein HQ584_12760 [Patescibacteria group bacterium]|nr:hypothetical protein [Patescibacteria group bacterium]